MPTLTVQVPEDVTAIETHSPGVRIVPAFGANAGVSYWHLTTPALLKGGGPSCAFDLNLSTVPKGAAVLTGSHGTVIDSVQIDSFGNLTVNPALAAASRLSERLTRTGWVRSQNTVFPAIAEAKQLLHRDSSVVWSDLHCSDSEIIISLSRDPRHPSQVTYDFTYRAIDHSRK